MVQWNKKIVMLLIIFLALTLYPASASAQDNYESVEKARLSTISPRLTYIDSADTDLIINGNVATVDCWVKGDVLDATKAKVIAELQLKSGNNWIAYGTWTETANAFKASVYETKSVKAGQTYRVKATYTVWEGSQSETIVVFSDEVTA